ncbi:MAG: PepSY domain-containing protein [Pseudomonadaceae bacterium]|nr:PepSY domain-containing protein [Pseudomonadaceae bacterium]
MNALTKLFTVAALSAVAGLAQARDLGVDETQKLVAAGTIQSVEKLNAAAIAKHPGATIEETDLEQENGQYIYEVDLRDAQGLQWDLELDATNGKVLKDHQDT